MLPHIKHQSFYILSTLKTSYFDKNLHIKLDLNGWMITIAIDTNNH